MSVIAVADRGAMFDPGHCVYMDKLVVGADLAGLVDVRAPIEDTLAAIDRARGSSVAEVTAALLERPRHVELVRRIRAVGARIGFLVAGDVARALMALLPESEVDVLVEVGGSLEGIVAAACMGGAIYGQLRPRNEQERRHAEAWVTTCPGCSPPPTSSAARTSTSWPPGSPTGTSFEVSGTRPTWR